MKFRLIAATCAALLLGVSAAGATPITDPVKFVKSMYALIQAGKPTPDDINSPRLQKLYDLNTHDFGSDEVGRIDFDIWMNAQDGTFTNVNVTGVPVENGAGREVVIAKFRNEGKPQEVHFYFEKIGGNWKLDDARGLSGETWTLSLILKYGWDGKP